MTLSGALGRSGTLLDALEGSGTVWDALGRSGTLWGELSLKRDALIVIKSPFSSQGRSLVQYGPQKVVWESRGERSERASAAIDVLDTVRII